MSTRMGQRTARNGSAVLALFGLVLTLAAGAVAAAAMTLCESAGDQLVYVCFAAAAATAGWVLQVRHGRLRA